MGGGGLAVWAWCPWTRLTATGGSAAGWMEWCVQPAGSLLVADAGPRGGGDNLVPSPAGGQVAGPVLPCRGPRFLSFLDPVIRGRPVGPGGQLTKTNMSRWMEKTGSRVLLTSGKWDPVSAWLSAVSQVSQISPKIESPSQTLCHWDDHNKPTR